MDEARYQCHSEPALDHCGDLRHRRNHFRSQHQTHAETCRFHGAPDPDALSVWRRRISGRATSRIAFRSARHEHVAKNCAGSGRTSWFSSSRVRSYAVGGCSTTNQLTSEHANRCAFWP